MSDQQNKLKLNDKCHTSINHSIFPSDKDRQIFLNYVVQGGETQQLIRMVSSTINPSVSSSLCRTNKGQPLAMFISSSGFCNEALSRSGSGWKFLIIFLPPVWLINLKVTLDVNGHCRRSSQSPFMITKNTNIPIPSPRMSNLRHIL